MEYREKYNKVEEHIKNLRNAHLPVKKRREVLDYMRRHLTYHPGDGSRLLEAGIVKAITDFVDVLLAGGRAAEGTGQRPADAEVVQTVGAAASVLLQLSVTKSDAVDLQREGTICTLMKLLDGNLNSTIRSRGCRGLGNILQTMHSAAAHTVIQKHVTELCTAIVGLFDSPNLHEVALKSVRQAITCVPLKKPLLRSDLFTAALLPVLASADTQPAPILQQTLMCLTSFVMDSLESDVSADLIARHMTPQLRRLVQLASVEAPGVQQAAIDLLCRLASNDKIRNNMGSNGVISCFIEHLSFDPQQTTVSSVQKKIIYALTLCCREGFNRAKISDIGGMRVLTDVLGSRLYASVHIHILSCLTEFKHDDVSLGLMVTGYGAVGHAARYLNAALDVLYPFSATEENSLSTSMDDSDTSLAPAEVSSSTLELPPDPCQPSPFSTTSSSSKQVTPRRFSCHSPSYRNVLQESESRRQLVFSSPAFSSPAIDEDLRRALYSSTCVSPQSTMSGLSEQSSGPSSPISQASMGWGLRGETGGLGRYSPVVEMETEEDELVSPVKDSQVIAPEETGGNVTIKRKREDDPEVDPSSPAKKACPDPPPYLTRENAKNCLKYIVPFFEAVSYRKNLLHSLAVSSVIFAFVKYLERAPSNFETSSEQTSKVKSVFQTLLRIVKEPNCFEALLKIGLPLVLQETQADLPASTVKAKKEALSHLRMHASGEFGFGEMLHLSLCSSREIRMNCIACASILIQTRADRVKFFKKNSILDQLMSALMDFTGGTEHRRMVTQALHGFFLDEFFTENTLTYPGLSGDQDSPTPSGSPPPDSTTSCLLTATPSTESTQDTFILDDSTLIPFNRRLLTTNSEVFAAMLGVSFLEGQTPSPVIPIRETPSPAFLALVHHFSGCRPTTCPALISGFSHPETLLHLIQLADRFLAFKLRDFACQILLEKYLDGETAGPIFECSVAMVMDFVGEKLLERVLKWPEMGLEKRAAVLTAVLRCDCALVAVNFIRVLLETTM